MYVLAGKGSVAGADLANYIVRKCQQEGVLWDDDLPEYTLDFLTQLPSVSKSIRENQTDVLISMINKRLVAMQDQYNSYMILNFSAHQFITHLNTKLKCINLIDLALQKISDINGKIAFLGIDRGFPAQSSSLVLLENHQELIEDLVVSIKRGYVHLGNNYAANPKKILEKILKLYREQGVSKFFLACTDFHVCKEYLIELGVNEIDIIDIIELAGDEIIKQKGRQYTTSFLDDISDAKTHFRYKSLSSSDSPKVDIKNEHLYKIFDNLPDVNSDQIDILDVGGSSSGHSIKLANKFRPRHSHITLQDISLNSLNAARSLYDNQYYIRTTFEHGNIEYYKTNKKFDVILCLGVLLCISSDKQFEKIVHKISNLMDSGGFLITRDALTNEMQKKYQSFGGVIRNEQYYHSVFNRFGLNVLTESSFIIDTPISRKIKTVLWEKV